MSPTRAFHFQDEAGEINNTHTYNNNQPKVVEKIEITLDASTDSSPSPPPSPKPRPQSPQITKIAAEEYVLTHFIHFKIHHHQYKKNYTTKHETMNKLNE